MLNFFASAPANRICRQWCKIVGRESESMGVPGWVPGAVVKEEKIAKVDMTLRRDEFWDACEKVHEWELYI